MGKKTKKMTLKKKKMTLEPAGGKLLVTFASMGRFLDSVHPSLAFSEPG